MGKTESSLGQFQVDANSLPHPHSLHNPVSEVRENNESGLEVQLDVAIGKYCSTYISSKQFPYVIQFKVLPCHDAKMCSLFSQTLDRPVHQLLAGGFLVNTMNSQTEKEKTGRQTRKQSSSLLVSVCYGCRLFLLLLLCDGKLRSLSVQRTGAVET